MVDTLGHHGIARVEPRGERASIQYAWVFHNRYSYADIRLALAVPSNSLDRVRGSLTQIATKATWATTMRVERLYQPEQTVGFLTDRKSLVDGLTLHTSWALTPREAHASMGVPLHAS
jgi:hypothetical protein